MAAIKIWILVSILSLPSLVSAETLPAPFTANYAGTKYLVFDIESNFKLEQFGEYLKYTFHTRGHFMFISNELYDCSVMRIANNELYPVEHKHTDKKDSKYNASTRFDWNQGIAHVEIGDGRKLTVKDLKKPLWDPLSLQVHLMSDVMNGQLQNPKTYQLIEYGELSQWPIHIKKTTSLETEHSKLNTVMVERTDGKSFKLWFARDFGFIPAQIELQDTRLLLTSKPDQTRRPVQPTSTEVPHC